MAESKNHFARGIFMASKLKLIKKRYETTITIFDF